MEILITSVFFPQGNHRIIKKQQMNCFSTEGIPYPKENWKRAGCRILTFIFMIWTHELLQQLPQMPLRCPVGPPLCLPPVIWEIRPLVKLTKEEFGPQRAVYRFRGNPLLTQSFAIPNIEEHRKIANLKSYFCIFGTLRRILDPKDLSTASRATVS